jgi:hypothetical protein
MSVIGKGLASVNAATAAGRRVLASRRAGFQPPRNSHSLPRETFRTPGRPRT